MSARPTAVLLQARHFDDAQLEAERRLFAERLALPPTDVASHNLLTGPPQRRAMVGHDVILIGGSGDFYVSNGLFPQQEAIFEALREAVEGPRPIFASCFGFHLLTAALGGEVIHDPERMELGTYRIELTPAGREDQLLGRLPAGFDAQLGRKDRALKLPGGVKRLAGSELCPHQAFKVERRPVWATQFHPELDEDSNRERYLTYAAGYSGVLGSDAHEEVLRRFAPSPETGGLLRGFLDLVLS